MSAIEDIKAIQKILGVTADGDFGKQSQAALDAIAQLAKYPAPNIDTAGVEWHSVKASSFADPADVAAFRRCKARGGTDQQCFSQGDNGVGFTGIDVSGDDKAYCALPPEVWLAKWGSKANASGKPVLVRVNGIVASGFLGDTMPHLENIHNGAGVDLNPGFAKALGLRQPFLVSAEWAWA